MQVETKHKKGIQKIAEDILFLLWNKGILNVDDVYSDKVIQQLSYYLLCIMMAMEQNVFSGQPGPNLQKYQKLGVVPDLFDESLFQGGYRSIFWNMKDSHRNTIFNKAIKAFIKQIK